MKRSVLLGLLITGFALSLRAQHPNIVIGTNNGPNEPSICINPRNTNQIVAGANLDIYYLSNDGGNTWSEGTIASSNGVWGDPCIIADTNGDFYFFHLANPPTPGNWIDRIVCQKMNSFGGWTDGSYFGINGIKNQDKEWAVVNPFNNHIYACWTQFDNYNSSNSSDSSRILFVKSMDGGMTWTSPVRLSKRAGDCLDSDNTVEGAVPAVGPGGQIYVAWSGPLGIMFDRSLNEGSTWLPNDIFVADQPGGWDYPIPGISRSNGLPVTCCDLSHGPYRGNIYVNWSDQRNGTTDTNIWFAKSTDGGNTWSAPRRVNDDPPGRQQFFTWMTVDQVTGILYFVFFDRRNYSDSRTDVYLAISRDGGESFINYKISESPFNPTPSIFFGDYTNVSAVNNVIRPIWTRLDNGQLSIMTALIDPTIIGMEDQSGSPLSIEQNFPNPFTENTKIAFKVRRSCRINLKVIDILGHECATIIDNEFRKPGNYIESLDSSRYNLQPGVYFFSLTSNGQVLKKQMLLVK